ncbi:hypothetical protein COV16_00195 [Candidatus Woesearchaeota archaeon CG10_big_fil_rev_8_21_14_0_10_34_8]|jgi:hypothetical protein|nr:MAG: hypothetical protein COV16_00195 [Candidatus Woesearchaeota archaeon CG10_big_fil_rev_8_21_14_0_10_34_8]
MNKRGQITIFVILGIVIVASLILLFTFRKDILPPTTEAGINAQMREAKNMITDCLEKESLEPINKIALQGGYLSPGVDTFRLWNDTQISYLCFNIENQDNCRNRLLTIRNMEEQLSKVIENNLPTCVDLSEIGGVNIEANKPFIVTTRILPLQVLVELEYPVTVKSKIGEASASEKKFSYIVDAPLGDLYNVAQDILDQETSVGIFDQLSYMLLKLGKYTVYVEKPYPDKIYRLKFREGSYMFQFGIQGEPS